MSVSTRTRPEDSNPGAPAASGTPRESGYHAIVTGHLPFNPDDAAGPPPEPGPARREQSRFPAAADGRELSVSELSEIIRRTLEERIPSPLRVVGEVSNLNVRNHWYFSLKDESAVVQCVAWASSAKRFRFEAKDGQQVVATGHVSHYGPQGRTQFYVRALVPVGAGALELRFRALCEELRGLGYFDEARKRPLPAYPRRIAVVTSKTGAALQDVINTCAQRWQAVGLLVVDVRVQGEGAAESVADAIDRINASRAALGVDAILVTRGGGSIEDLWAFNERVVADAVFRSALPVVAAIGHESDTTIIDLVADVRAATPTQAVMRLVPARSQLAQQLDHLAHRLRSLTGRRLERERERVASLARTELLRNPRAIVARARLDFQQRSTSCRRAIRNRLQREREAGRFREQRLASVDVHRVLRRGFTYTLLESGRLLQSVGDVSRGDRLATHVADGVVESTVGGSSARSPRRPTATPPPPMDLFEKAD